MMSETQLSYFAGFFDGEGCIGIYFNPKAKSASLRSQLVQNLSPKSWNMFSELVDHFGGRLRQQPTINNNVKLSYELSGDAACYFLEAIMPYLVLKKEQARFATSWQRQRPQPLRYRDNRGRIATNPPEMVLLNEQASQVSRHMKTMSFDEISQEYPELDSVLTIILGMKFPNLDVREGPVDILETLYPIGVAMAGHDVEDPFRD